LENLKVNRKKIFNELRLKNIGVHVHYIPVYFHPYYQKLGYRKGICPNTEWLYNRILTLPLYPKMKDEDVDFVIKSVIKIVNNYSKN
jgi:dTDP-4-amino-4,6-dideoxygalactose transaminase